jgi:hypothetical protein
MLYSHVQEAEQLLLESELDASSQVLTAGLPHEY